MRIIVYKIVLVFFIMNASLFAQSDSVNSIFYMRKDNTGYKLYVMKMNGSNNNEVIDVSGYNGIAEVSYDGTKILTQDAIQVIIYDMSLAKNVFIDNPPGKVVTYSYMSKNGEKICLFAYNDDNPFEAGIYIVGTNNIGMRKLVSTETAGVVLLNISPNGNKIVYSKKGVGENKNFLRMINAENDNEIQIFNQGFEYYDNLKFTHDNNHIIFRAYVDPWGNESYTYILDLQTLEYDSLFTELTNTKNYQFSEDNNMLFFQRNEWGQEEIYRYDFDRNHYACLTRDTDLDCRNPKLSAEDNSIIYDSQVYYSIDSVLYSYDVFSMDISGENKSNLTNISNYCLNPFVTRIKNPTAINQAENINISYNLFQNYPNPFNPTTTINYSIKDRGFVQLKVYDVLGKEVATLINKEKRQGNYSVSFNGSNLPSGIYLYSLRINNFQQSRKMILLR